MSSVQKKIENTSAVTDLTYRQDYSSGTRNLSQDMDYECWYNLTMSKNLAWTCIPWNNERRNYATNCMWWFRSFRLIQWPASSQPHRLLSTEVEVNCCSSWEEEEAKSANNLHIGPEMQIDSSIMTCKSLRQMKQLLYIIQLQTWIWTYWCFCISSHYGHTCKPGDW